MERYYYGEYLDRTTIPVCSRFIAGQHVTECGINDTYGQYNGTKKIAGKKDKKLWLENLHGSGHKRHYHHYNYHNPKQMRKGTHIRNYLLQDEYLIFHHQERPYLIERVNLSGYVSKWYVANNKYETAVMMANKFHDEDLRYRYDENPLYTQHQLKDDKKMVKLFAKDEKLASLKVHKRKLHNAKIDMANQMHVPTPRQGPVMQNIGTVRSYEVPVVESYVSDIPSVISNVNDNNVYYSGPAHHDQLAHRSQGGNDQSVFIENPEFIPTVENVSEGHLVEQYIDREVGTDSIEYKTTSTTTTEYVNDGMVKSVKSEFSPKVIKEDSMPIQQQTQSKKKTQKDSKGKKVKTATMM